MRARGFSGFRLVQLAGVVVTAAVAASCSNNRGSSPPSASPAVAPAPGAEALRAVSASTSDAAVAPAPAPDQATAPLPLPAPAMVIRNGAVTVEVDSLERAIAAVESLAKRLGGYVGNTSLSAGAYETRSATLELKVPAARYDSAVSGLAPIGRIETQTSTAQDVGEEFVDVSARQANAHRLEERLIALLATRTGKLEDVLAVERELARIREEIERYEGRLRYLTAHVATSTLVVTVHERRPIISEYAGRNVIVESFKNSWRNFVSFVALFIASLGWLIPLAAVLVAAAFAFRRVKRRG